MYRKNHSIMLALIFFAFTAISQNQSSGNSAFNAEKKAQANQYVKTTESMKQIASIKGVIFEDDFESNLGWTFEGGWVIDTAVVEPDVAHSGTNILANPLGVDYENSMIKESVVSPVIDCSSQTAVFLSYWSFSGCETSTFDHIGVEVFDGGSWVEIWSNDDWGASTQEDAWTYYELNVTDYAVGNANFQVAFYLGETDASVTYSGWAIDDLIVFYPEAHDLGVLAVYPKLVIPETEYTPAATIKNFGGSVEDAFNVEIEITDDGGSQVFIDNVDFTDSIGISEEFTAEMSIAWTPATEGTYTVTATVTVADDANPENDQLSEECTAAYMYFMSNDTVTTCMGLFYDSGGPDEDYEMDEYYVMTFYHSTGGAMMQVEFLSYEVEGSTYDYLAIYNGESINAELIDTHEGTADDFYFQGQTISASNPTGALTFEFTSDGSILLPGWEAVLSCVNAVTFHVTDAGITNIENALVEVDGQSGLTNAEGNAMFALEEGEVTYTVTADFCDPFTDNYTVTSEPGQVVEVSLTCVSEYLVTFNAFENFGSNDPVEGVDIEVTHTTTGTVWNETTNASGNAEFLLPAADFEFSVSAQGYIYSGTTSFTVSSNMTVDLPLDEDFIAPSGLVIEIIDSVQGIVDFSWFAGFSGNILVVDHDATNAIGEFTDDWPYIQPALDIYEINYTYFEADATTFEGPDLATMQEYDIVFWFTGEGWQNNQTMTANDETNLATYLDGGGKLFLSSQDYVWDVYSQASQYTFSSGQFPYDYLGLISITQDAWWNSGGESLAHEGVIGSLAEGYSFQCDDIYSSKDGLSGDLISGNNETDMLNVTDAPAGVTAIQSDNVVCWLGSIASVTDEQIRADLIMDVFDFLTIGKSNNTTKSFESFNVYLDDMGTPVATGITDSTYQFTDLTPGQSYTAGVSATYTSGESDVTTIDFTIPLGIGINDDINSLISIFPNPSNGYFTVTTDKPYKLEIMDITGKVIIKRELTHAQTDIDMSNQGAGLYFIRLANDKSTFNYKIIVE